MTGAHYRNHGHYIAEGWAREPKESFKEVAAHIARLHQDAPGRLLDVGCATGELIGYLGGRFPGLSFTGVDVFEELLAEARKLAPCATFLRSSALELPEALHGAFDIVTAIGCMSIFDETEIEIFWSNLLRAVRPGGTVIVLAPLNEYGVDTMIRHRKRMGGRLGAWETGWNIFSRETVQEILSGLGQPCELHRFSPDLRLAPREDPVRTWTVGTEHNPRQLTNGLKLLVDHYFILAGRLSPSGGPKE